MMRIIDSVEQWRVLRKSSAFQNKTVGFVPTMGALHAGHFSLLARSRRENDLSVLSLFVNPTQFNDPQDFAKYPSTRDEDLQNAEKFGTDFVFIPKYADIYTDNYRFKVEENQVAGILCGRSRPGHFTGVLTIVMKLLTLVQARRAYFGEKDFQQYLLIKSMVDAFFIDTEIVPCPTVRDEDGLALSSRNQRLSTDERKMAGHFPAILRSSQTLAQVRAELETYGLRVDYVEEFAGRRFGAVYAGTTRLIDNVAI